MNNPRMIPVKFYDKFDNAIPSDSTCRTPLLVEKRKR